MIEHNWHKDKLIRQPLNHSPLGDVEVILKV